MAYLVAKCCHINDTDSNGMTALMWSCFRANGLDPTRMLLTLVRRKYAFKEICEKKVALVQYFSFF